MKKRIPTEEAIFTPSDSDLLAMLAHREAIISGYNTGRNKEHILSAVMLAALALIIYNSIQLYREHTEPGSQFTYIVVALFTYIAILIVRRFLNTRAEIQSYIDTNGWCKLEQTIITSNRSVKVLTEFGTSEYSWNSFTSFIDDESRAMIGAGVGLCIVMPKGIGISSDRIEWIREHVTERMMEM